MMDKKIKLLITGALAAGVILGLIPETGTQAVRALALPFELVGMGLRYLSLSGTAGNIGALILYCLICLSPLLLIDRKSRNREDLLLLLASGVLFYVMYLMVNPFRIPANLGEAFGKGICAGAVISVFVTWGILKLLRARAFVQTRNIYRALRIFLMICAVECILVGCGMRFGDFRAAVSEVQSANTMPGLNLIPTYIFLFLSRAATAMEYALDAAVMLLGAALLRELELDAYSDKCAAVAEKTVAWCKGSLASITLVNLSLNLGQLVFASSLHNMDFQIRLPVMSMAIVFAAMTLTRLLSQGKALKEDNDLFI